MKFYLFLILLWLNCITSLHHFLRSFAMLKRVAKARRCRGASKSGIRLYSSSEDIASSYSGDSVHLKLSSHETHDGADENRVSNVSTSFTIKEFVLTADNSTLVACTGDIETHSLESFGMHLYDTNFSSRSDVFIRERIVEMKDKDSFDAIINLWKSEKLLVKSKDFPNNLLRGKEKENFRETVMGHARKMKRLLQESSVTDPYIKDFLTLSEADQYRKTDHCPWDETLKTLKSFSLWFRSQFPYYYQGCLHCGNQQGNDCYGLVYPSVTERPFDAGRTELYICSKCRKTTRFPRFNAVHKVLETRRGRCGEYSILMLRMLRELGYEVRWVVDWADHVWCEVFVESKWVHVDPCEAAVDEPLIYEGWGKNQTYIVAYSFTEAEDVTHAYTTRFNESLERRHQDGVSGDMIRIALDEAEEYLGKTE